MVALEDEPAPVDDGHRVGLMQGAVRVEGCGHQRSQVGVRRRVGPGPLLRRPGNPGGLGGQRVPRLFGQR